MAVVPASSHKDYNVTRPMRLCSHAQMIQKSYPENAAAHGSRRTNFVQARLLVAGRAFFPEPQTKPDRSSWYSLFRSPIAGMRLNVPALATDRDDVLKFCYLTKTRPLARDLRRISAQDAFIILRRCLGKAQNSTSVASSSTTRWHSHGLQKSKRRPVRLVWKVHRKALQ